MPELQSTIARQVHQQARATPGFAGGGTVWTEPVLVINQKAKFYDVVSEYKVFDQHARQLATVREEGGKRWLRLLVNKALLPAHVAVQDMNGGTQLRLDKKFSLWRPQVFLQDADHNVIGQFVWTKFVGKAQIQFHSNGQVVGCLRAQNWRAWNFTIEDGAGMEVAAISKTWAGLGKELFTNADNYVLSMHRPLDGPLLAFTVMSALCIDTVLKQSNGR